MQTNHLCSLYYQMWGSENTFGTNEFLCSPFFFQSPAVIVPPALVPLRSTIRCPLASPPLLCEDTESKFLSPWRQQRWWCRWWQFMLIEYPLARIEFTIAWEFMGCYCWRLLWASGDKTKIAPSKSSLGQSVSTPSQKVISTRISRQPTGRKYEESYALDEPELALQENEER